MKSAKESRNLTTKPEKKLLIAVTAAAAVILVGVLGYLWLQASTDSYDQRFSDCMNAKQTLLYPQGHYWPDNEYNAAMRECDQKAGLPSVQTTAIPTPEISQ